MTVHNSMSNGLSPDLNLALTGSRVLYNDHIDCRRHPPVFNTGFVNQYSTRSFNGLVDHIGVKEITDNEPQRLKKRISSGSSVRSISRGSVPASTVSRRPSIGQNQRFSPGIRSVSDSPKTQSYVESHIQHEKEYIEMALSLKRFQPQKSIDLETPLQNAHQPSQSQTRLLNQSPNNAKDTAAPGVERLDKNLSNDIDRIINPQDLVNLKIAQSVSPKDTYSDVKENIPLDIEDDSGQHMSRKCSSKNSNEKNDSEFEDSENDDSEIEDSAVLSARSCEKSDSARSLVAEIIHNILQENTSHNADMCPNQSKEQLTEKNQDINALNAVRDDNASNALLGFQNLEPVRRKNRRKKRRSGRKTRLKHRKADKVVQEDNMVTQTKPDTRKIYSENKELSQLQAFVTPIKVLPSNMKQVKRQMSMPTVPPSGSDKNLTRMSHPHISTHKLQMNHSDRTANHRTHLTTRASLASTMEVAGRSRSLSHVHVTTRQPGDASHVRVGGAVKENIERLVKVFLSERQSAMLSEGGVEFPSAPPATPTPAMLRKYEYIPCMNDIRSQRAVKVQLEEMRKVEKKRKEIELEEKMRQNKINEKQRMKNLKIRQRREIYALNKAMTELENKNFRTFVEVNGLRTKKR